jgi:hypothetical protein
MMYVKVKVYGARWLTFFVVGFFGICQPLRSINFDLSSEFENSYFKCVKYLFYFIFFNMIISNKIGRFLIKQNQKQKNKTSLVIKNINTELNQNKIGIYFKTSRYILLLATQYETLHSFVFVFIHILLVTRRRSEFC